MACLPNRLDSAGGCSDIYQTRSAKKETGNGKRQTGVPVPAPGLGLKQKLRRASVHVAAFLGAIEGSVTVAPSPRL